MTNEEKHCCSLIMVIICTVALLSWLRLWMKGTDTISPFSDFVGETISEVSEWKEALFDISDFLLSTISGDRQYANYRQKIDPEMRHIISLLEIAINLMLLIGYVLRYLLRMQVLIFEMLFFTEIAYVTRPLAIVYLGYKLRPVS